MQLTSSEAQLLQKQGRFHGTCWALQEHTQHKCLQGQEWMKQRQLDSQITLPKTHLVALGSYFHLDSIRSYFTWIQSIARAICREGWMESWPSRQLCNHVSTPYNAGTHSISADEKRREKSL